MVKSIFYNVSRFCAYSHIFKVLSVLKNGENISDQTRTGRNIALLGIFCPIFWYALFTGASTSELIFHATHSSIVFLIGVGIIFISLKKKKQ